MAPDGGPRDAGRAGDASRAHDAFTDGAFQLPMVLDASPPRSPDAAGETSSSLEGGCQSAPGPAGALLLLLLLLFQRARHHERP